MIATISLPSLSDLAASASAAEPQRKLAFEEVLISEGSDWNWWYGPEHHSANDRDFDELYRKHLSNIYQALGARPPQGRHVLLDPNTSETKPDGNNVTIEDQLLKMGQVQADFAAMTNLYRKQQALMRTALGKGGG